MSRAKAMHRRDGWERASAPSDKLRARWIHETGWEVRHCGHPTAIWPYYAVNTSDGSVYVAANGRGFPSLLEACVAVEQQLPRVLRGEACTLPRLAS